MVTAQYSPADIATAVAAASLKLRKQSPRYADDPIGFICNRLGEFTWSKQREVAESVRDNRHTAVRSSHDTGKSFIASRLAAWWIASHEPGEAFVVTTAPSWPQVRAILWREINRAHVKGKLPGTTNQTEWMLGGELVAYGRKPADYDEHGFQGIHARYVLVILDEACGIPRNLWTAVETLVTNEGSRILAIGNPDTPLSHFKEVCDRESNWHVIHIDGLSSPNFTDEFEQAIESGDLTDEQATELRELLLSRTWVEERRQEWGEDSPLWASKVRGEFPTVPQGQVYRELSASQQWVGELPKFKKYIGGLDFGGANDTAHWSAGVIAGVVARASSGERQLAPEDSIIRFAQFEHAGPSVAIEQTDWMRSWETRLGRRIEWVADKSQAFGIGLLDEDAKDPSVLRSRFRIQPSHGGSDSVWFGIGLQRARMARGAAFFTGPKQHPSDPWDDLTAIPRFSDGRLMNGRSWFERMSNYRWKDEPNEDRAVPGVPIKRNDDLVDADRYMHEAVDGFPVYTGPAVATRTVTGAPRKRGMA